MRVTSWVWVPVLAVLAALGLRGNDLYHLQRGFAGRDNDGACVLVGGPRDAAPIIGSEDAALWRSGVALVSSGDLRNAFDGTPAAPGAVFAVDLARSPPTHKRLTVSVDAGLRGAFGTPAFPFQPHGLHFSNATQRLYVVSHGLAAGGGSRVLVFRVTGHAFADVALELESDVTSPAFGNGAINDVIEGATRAELYVTVFQACSLPAGGLQFARTLADHACAMTRGLAQAFVPATHVLRCVLPPADADAGGGGRVAAACAPVARGFHFANGITKTPDTAEVFVVDSAAAVVAVFARRPDGALVRTGGVPLPRGVSADNVEFDAASGRLTLGANTALSATMAFMHDAARVPVPGAVFAAARAGADSPWIVEPLLQHAGDVLPMVSAGLTWGARVLVGSPYSTGVLVCDDV